MEDAAAGGGDGAVTIPPPAPTCPICMEPWTCNGDHRICCIPCGHVYGRSCLVKWLHRCGDDTAKCPQCGEQFEDKLIINLYAPGNLWDGCCRFEPDFEAAFDAVYEEYQVSFQQHQSALTNYMAYVCAMMMAVQTRQRVELRPAPPLPGPAPPLPGPAPLMPSREIFAMTYYLRTPGTGRSRNQGFGQASESGREITPVHRGGPPPDTSLSGSSAAQYHPPMPQFNSDELGSGPLFPGDH
ncbi:hypothetical protein QYE76_035198 [Lolium multiflorum]|uniref:RING-type domain-containing protein n=1 Tax=Lolium multiflorum TaxID=4521 RepID=A0AAD8VNS3_LOLMU|nr:hypothetical protein QYE76_035198 [Lolium multiflorum]